MILDVRRLLPTLLTLLTLLTLVALLNLAALGASPSARAAQPEPADPVGDWPLLPEPDVVHDFDPPEDPYGSGHRGVDLAGVPGQVVRTALPGSVTFAGSLAGRGVVVVSHGDTRTTYEPVAATVRVGDEVRGGRQIGLLQVVGSHCFPRACLHWGWLRGETYLDPLRLVGDDRPVRLLPLWRDDPVLPSGTAPRGESPYVAWRPLVRLLTLPGLLVPGLLVPGLLVSG